MALNVDANMLIITKLTCMFSSVLMCPIIGLALNTSQVLTLRFKM